MPDSIAAIKLKLEKRGLRFLQLLPTRCRNYVAIISQIVLIQLSQSHNYQASPEKKTIETGMGLKKFPTTPILLVPKFELFSTT